jgi:hypothetical protein
MITYAKTINNSFGTLLLFMFSFQPSKVHNILALILDPHYKKLGLVIQYVGKQRAFHNASKYDRKVLFLFLVWIQKPKLGEWKCKWPRQLCISKLPIYKLYYVMESDDDLVS